MTPRSTGLLRVLLVAGIAAGTAASDASAQYFGRNKVQYEDFDFHVLRSEHFDLHYYPAAEEGARAGALMAERWYARLAGVLAHDIKGRQSVVLYADHTDFQQTNVIEGTIDESTGGVTESMQRRVVLPMTPVYQETDHVLGHELVHAFQYAIAAQNGGTGRMGLLPLWLVEGMAEYLSQGRVDGHTAMWLRDAVLHDDVPTLRKLSGDMRYFPYRFGQAVWAYIGGRWGDGRIVELYTESLKQGWEPAVEKVLDIGPDSLSQNWIEAVTAAYRPLLADRTPADSIGRRIAGERGGPGALMLGPAASPDGRYVAFLWARDFTVDLYLADARTGRVVKRLASGATDSHFDAVSFMGSAGAWSPDGQLFAAVVFAQGDQEIALIDVAAGEIRRRIRVSGVSAIATPAWSPDGRTIAFTGSAGGLSDLYLLDVVSGSVRRLTADRFADLQPAWSPDGRTLAFVSDRGDAAAFERLEHAPLRIATIDVATGGIRTLPLLPHGTQLNPQYAPDGRDLFFLADADGFRDIYRARLETGELFRVTRVATGISGLTALSPALSVASRTGDIVFSIFNRRGYAIGVLGADEAHGTPVDGTHLADAGAAVLPPAGVLGDVHDYLADAATGVPDTASIQVRQYSPRPKLSYFGLPTLGIGVDRFGASVYANLQAYFTDVLGDHGVFVQALANGSFRDVGGSALYESRGGRWNWAVGGGHIPYVTRYRGAQEGVVNVNGRPTSAVALTEYRERLVLDQALGSVRYPLSATRRLEASAGVTHIGYSFQLEQNVQVGGNTVSRQTSDLATPIDFTLWQAGAAFVGDHSLFGIASPIDGGRYRFELQPTLGSFRFITALADWRRYQYVRPVTFGIRALHYGRYGSGADQPELGTLFLGAQGLVRGYDYNSFTDEDCTTQSSGYTGCAELDRLFGSRLAVASAELRVPLFGNERYGLFDFRFLPTELALFVDGGMAWTRADGPALSGGPAARTPVFSAGASARFNLFGALVVETYYALPFQRTTGGRFGIQLVPGW